MSRQALCRRDHMCYRRNMQRERDQLDPTAAERRLICEGCGQEFGCARDNIAECWCNAEAYRLPLPTAGGRTAGCLCPACLRQTAAKALPGTIR